MFLHKKTVRDVSIRQSNLSFTAAGFSNQFEEVVLKPIQRIELLGLMAK